MSDIAIPGFSSDSNTAKQIDNLMKAKRIPLDKMENRQEEYTNLKGIWQDLKVTLSNLSDSSKKLYGFENPFNEKSVNSSNDSILTAKSERNAIDENLSFVVKRLATADKFVSKQLDKEFKIPKGNYTFSIGEKDTVFKFRGGSIDDFVTKFNKKNPDEIRASLIKNSKNTQVMLIESLKTGSENKLVFKNDALTLGVDMGLIEKNNIESRKLKVNDIIASKGAIEKSNTLLEIPSTSEASFRVNSNITDNDLVEVTLELINKTKGSKEDLPVDDIDIPSVTLEKITINSLNGSYLDREIKEDESTTESVIDMNIISLFNGKKTLKLDPIKDQVGIKQVLTFTGKDIENLKSITVQNNNSDKKVILHSVVLKKGAGNGEYVPTSPITVANDSLLSMNGMEIERETNTIDDLVDGTTVYLHKEDPDEKITLSIDFNTDLAKEEILNFIYDYNQSVQKILLLTNDDKAILSEIEFADDKAKEKAEEIQGLLRGDRTLNSIKQNLLRSITNPYPTENEKDFKLLKSIGISTNASGGSTGVNASKLRGYIEANIEELEDALKNNLPGVQKLFGNDTNNDFIIDTGVAKVIDDLLKPYTRTGGTIATRITTIDGKIKRTDKEITDYKDDLITYEQTIRRKYGQMDATLNSLNSSMTAIENLTNNGD